MRRILVTNDDGVWSEGVRALAAALESFGRVTIVAPHGEASAIGHALTLVRPLRMEQVADGVYSVDGTPTDCVNIAVTQLFDGMPDLIASGINKGWNLGDDVTYSGTVAGALEGALLGVPAIAVSLQRTRGVFDFDQAARAAGLAAEQVFRHGLPSRTFLNINVPDVPARGFRVTVQAKRNHITAVKASVDPRMRPYYWIEEGQSEWEPHDRSDYQAVRDGFISVTPLHPDLTNHAALPAIEALSFEVRAEVE